MNKTMEQEFNDRLSEKDLKIKELELALETEKSVRTTKIAELKTELQTTLRTEMDSKLETEFANFKFSEPILEI